jgi:hypothetical protein
MYVCLNADRLFILDLRSLVIEKHLPSCASLLHNLSTQSQAWRQVRQPVQLCNHLRDDRFHGYRWWEKGNKLR